MDDSVLINAAGSTNLELVSGGQNRHGRNFSCLQ
jgi:hypothetical protein